MTEPMSEAKLAKLRSILAGIRQEHAGTWPHDRNFTNGEVAALLAEVERLRLMLRLLLGESDNGTDARLAEWRTRFAEPHNTFDVDKWECIAIIRALLAILAEANRHER